MNGRGQPLREIPRDEPVLFAMHLRYDEEAVTPVHRYDPADHTLTLGLSDASIRVGRSAGRGRRSLPRNRPRR